MFRDHFGLVRGVAAFVLVAGAATGCESVGLPLTRNTAPLFDGMGSHHRAVTTESKKAQRYFDQGLIWTYSFNYDEATRSFRQAAALDPECAMAYWGIALANGPHINRTQMTDEQSRIAWEAINQARVRAHTVTEIERDLIEALATRYAWPPPADRTELDRAYAAAMKAVYAKYPDDADVATLYAESLMDLWPWDLWSVQGEPRPDTPEIVAVLERALEIDPNHPGANHLYIHAVEASPNPEKGVAAADRLRTLVPISGHMVHMPGHIDARVGRWDLASDANVAAIKADRRYRRISPRQDFYRTYMMHNDHFLAWSCMMEGRSADAIAAARRMVADVPEDYARENAAIVDAYTPIVVEALIRFGKWDEILAEPAPPQYLPITTAFWRFARATAYNAKGQIDEAVAEQQRFRELVKSIPSDALMAINPAHDMLKIADLVLDAEIAYRKGDVESAVQKLTEAAKMEDVQLYMEPPDWPQPVRHALGGILIAEKRYAEAEQVYRDDLKRWPENGWSLFGLAQALHGQGKEEAYAVEARFKKAWARADVVLRMTCMCLEE